MDHFSGTVTSMTEYHVKGELDAQTIRVAPDKPVTFVPGQYCMLACDGFALRADASKLKWTPYSLVSSPDEKELEFVYTIKRTGGFTQWLCENLKLGSTLRLKGPMGHFVLEENEKEKILVATGAGIAPMMSMIRFLVRRNQHPHVFFGFRTSEHFLYRKELERLASEKKISLSPTISRDDANWSGHRGYVQSLLKKREWHPRKQEVYVCGSPTMVQDVRAFFLKKGFPEKAVKKEQW